MKTSIALITLLAGCSLLAHAKTVSAKTTTSFEGGEPAVADTKVISFSGIEASCTLTCDDVTTSADLLHKGNAADLNDCYIPNTDVGIGSTWTITLSYNIKEMAPNLELYGFKLTYVTFDGEGENIQDGASRGVSFDLKFYDAATHTELRSVSKSNTITDEEVYTDNSTGVSFTSSFTDAPLAIEDDFYVTITATATNNTLGTTAYYGLRNTEMSFRYDDAQAPPPAAVVPEPATATLSLLALAGLAAQRRRR